MTLVCEEEKDIPIRFQISEIGNKTANNNGYRITFYIDPPKIRALVFKGGGARGFFNYRGFLQEIEKKENRTLESTREIGGTSVGAIIAVLTAVPFHVPGSRVKLMRKFDLNKARDILGTSISWKIYKFITKPLKLISKPLKWISQGIDWVAQKFNQSWYGSLIGWQLSFIAGILRLTSIITHPSALAGLYNLIIKGGLYRGDKLQNLLGREISVHTKNALQFYLNNLQDEEQKWKLINKLREEAGLIKNVVIDKRSNMMELILVKDINFSHFHYLAKNYPQIGFKDVFITGTRCLDSTLQIFNYRNAPTMPLHKAIRISMSLPFIYQKVKVLEKYNGKIMEMKYMDGGCSDNFPIQHASPAQFTPFEEQFYTNKHARLGVRVEYKYEMDLLWKPPSKKNWFNRMLDRIIRYIYNKASGMDVYSPDDQVTRVMQNDYAQRTIQLYDHGIGLTDFDVNKNTKKQVCEQSLEATRAYFEAHKDEKMVIENYTDLNKMPLWMRKHLYDFLKDKKNLTRSIFAIDKPENELEMIRQEIIGLLENQSWRKIQQVLMTKIGGTLTWEKHKFKVTALKRSNQIKWQCSEFGWTKSEETAVISAPPTCLKP